MRLLSFAIATLLPLASAESNAGVGRPNTAEDVGSVRRLGRNRFQKLHKVSNNHQRRAQKGEESLKIDAGIVRRSLQGLTTCPFCPAGITGDPNFALPAGMISPDPAVGDGATCTSAVEYAMTLSPTDILCPRVQLAQMFCCPPAPVAVPEDETATTTEITTTEAPPATEAPSASPCPPTPALSDGPPAKCCWDSGAQLRLWTQL